MASRRRVSNTLLEEDYPGLGRYVWQPASGQLDWSPGLARIYGRETPPKSEAEFMACLHPGDRIRIEGETNAFLTGDADSYNHSFRIVRPDGEVRYIIDRARIERDENGHVTEIHGLNVDITDFPHLARASMDGETRPLMAQAAPAPRGASDAAFPEVDQTDSTLALADIDYRAGTFTLNAEAARLYGLGTEKMTVPRDQVHATFHPADRAKLHVQIQQALTPETGGRLATEHRIQWPDGTTRWLQVQKRIDFERRDGPWRPKRGNLAALDITDLKTVETALSENEERLALAQGIAGIASWDVNLKDGRTVWTYNLYDLLAIDRTTTASPELFMAKVHPDDADRLRSEFETAIANDLAFESEFRIIPREGVIRHLVGQGRVVEKEDGRATRIIGVNYDITQRKRSEIQLRDSELRLRTILDETAALVGVLDVDGTLREANSTALKAGGLDRLEVIGKPFWEAPWWTHDPAEVTRLKDAVARAAKGEYIRYDARVRGAGSTYLTIDFHLSPVCDADGNVKLLVPSAVDITERTAAEEKLRTAHDTFRHMVDNSPFGIYTVDADFRLMQVSQGARKVFENVRPLIGRDFAEVLRIIWAEPFASEAIARFRHTLKTGEPYQAKHNLKDRADLDRPEAYDWKIERITLPEGRFGVVCHFYDLSERLRHEEHINTLLTEVNHRSKNMLSLVTIIAKQTAATGTDSFIDRFSDRIRALAANQDVLVRSAWQSADLDHLLRVQLAHFADLLDDRIRLEGPSMGVIPDAAEKIGMAVHELATNAGKYGALSTAAGRVHISWRITGSEDEAEPCFIMDWREQGGPTVVPPSRTGFGSILSGSILMSSLDGDINTDYAPEGLHWHLCCPLDSVSATSRARQSRTSDTLPTVELDNN